MLNIKGYQLSYKGLMISILYVIENFGSVIKCPEISETRKSQEKI